MTRAMLPFLALALLFSQGAAVTPADAAGTCNPLPKDETLAQLAEEEAAEGDLLILIRHDEKPSKRPDSDLSTDGKNHAKYEMGSALKSIPLRKIPYYALNESEPRVKNTSDAAFMNEEIESATLERDRTAVVSWAYGEHARLRAEQANLDEDERHPKAPVLIVFVNSWIIDEFEAGAERKFACSEGLIGVVQSETKFTCKARFFPEEALGLARKTPNWFHRDLSGQCKREATDLGHRSQ